MKVETVVLALVVCLAVLYFLAHSQAGFDLFFKVKGSGASS